MPRQQGCLPDRGVEQRAEPCDQLAFIPLRIYGFQPAAFHLKEVFAKRTWRVAWPLWRFHVYGALLACLGFGLSPFILPGFSLEAGSAWVHWRFLPGLIVGGLVTEAGLLSVYTSQRTYALPRVGRLNLQARQTLRNSDFLMALRLLLLPSASVVLLYYWTRLLPFDVLSGYGVTFLLLALAQHLLVALPWELVLYLVFGGFTTLVSVASFTILDGVFNEWLGGFGPSMDWDWLIPKALSFALAITFAYVTNRRWVFNSHEPIGPELLRFVSSRVLASLIFEAGGLALLVNVWGLNKQGANLLVAVAVVLVNYVLSKWAVFIHKGQANARERSVAVVEPSPQPSLSARGGEADDQ